MVKKLKEENDKKCKKKQNAIWRYRNTVSVVNHDHRHSVSMVNHDHTLRTPILIIILIINLIYRYLTLFNEAAFSA